MRRSRDPKLEPPRTGGLGGNDTSSQQGSRREEGTCEKPDSSVRGHKETSMKDEADLHRPLGILARFTTRYTSLRVLVMYTSVAGAVTHISMT